jgi:hypothetical protein
MTSSEIHQLQLRIKQLEDTLAGKDADLAQMRLRLQSANIRLDKMIDQISVELKTAHRRKFQQFLVLTLVPSLYRA